MVYGTTFVMLDATFIMGYSMLAIHAFKSSVGTKVNVSTLSGIGLMFVGDITVLERLHTRRRSPTAKAKSS
jgi:hypothetical protein